MTAQLPGLTKEELSVYIRRALIPKRLWSLAAENLLMGTCAQESHMGRYITQMGEGPARGVFQMEGATYESILAESDIYRRGGIKLPKSVDTLIYDINAAIMSARLKYSMIPEKLPAADDIKGMARYWKKYYNTHLGKGTEDEFIHNYHKYIGE